MKMKEEAVRLGSHFHHPRENRWIIAVIGVKEEAVDTIAKFSENMHQLKAMGETVKMQTFWCFLNERSFTP